MVNQLLLDENTQINLLDQKYYRSNIMKALIKLAIMSFLVVFMFGCGKRTESIPKESVQETTTAQTKIEAGIIFETTNARELTFCIAGTGTIRIEWKDGHLTHNLYTRSIQAPWAIGETNGVINLTTPNDFGQVVINGAGIKYFSAGINRYTDELGIHFVGQNITKIDLTQANDLYWLQLDNNPLTGIDISKNTKLEYLYLTNNQISNLDISQNSKLRDLSINNNPITHLDISNNAVIRYVTAQNNQLTNFIFGNNPNIGTLDLTSNKLKNIDLTKVTTLIAVTVKDNQLSTLDISTNPLLISLDVSNNLLSGLNLDKNLDMETLWLSFNKFTGFDASKLHMLRMLEIYNNPLSAKELNKLFHSLSTNPIDADQNKVLLYSGNTGANDDEVDITIAHKRNWMVFNEKDDMRRHELELN